jgi:two-component system nitrate/nitrite response regulator NarL
VIAAPPAVPVDGRKPDRPLAGSGVRPAVPPRPGVPTGAPRCGVRVLVVEDHPLMVDALRACLEAEGYEVAAAPIESREAVLDAAADLRPAVVLLDVELGGAIGDGGDLVMPLNRLGTTVIVLSGTTKLDRIGALVEKGAAGFVPKTRSFDAVLAAVAAAAAHRPLMSEEESRRLRAALGAARRRDSALERLSPREAEILTDLADGKTVAEVAEDACVSKWTVRTQIRSILTKLEVNSQLAAVAMAHKAGWRHHR